ncbi:acyl-CoA thioester hydrolase [Marinobacter daqiaonensis]|uniref:Acyl-CoA thioester hydrolase n=1 Tax=Marinobacter daqiaonensis TaxID=650891 RepID=A0A1I6IKD8_9GAMM|nr:thioesterase family protein [Marinobacter daqiaonensis]SFR67182.1 acyl-CoA thioester hydrolase [Marinobacter daqiaonensis]
MSDHPFEFRFRVRYAECDAQQVVFNARYADYVDIAINEYIRVLFGDYQQMLERKLDIQVVSLTLNWSAPAHFDEVLCARVEPKHLGNTSMVLNIAFVRHPDEKAIAEADITYVMVNPDTMTKTPIPDDVRERIKTAGRGTVISHAGE